MLLFILDSVSHLTTEHAGAIVVCGSHGGASSAMHTVKFKPCAAFVSDAGMGKDNAGIEGLNVFDEHGIPAAAVDIWSARIGDGQDAYESGILSAVNRNAAGRGLRQGMSVKEAVLLLCRNADKGGSDHVAS